MGQILALIRAPLLPAEGNEEASQVQFPPRSGCYFGSYFIMGGEHFNTGRNDAYLFGDTQDLTFLSRRPVPFPYPAPAASEPSKTLQSLINIRRDTVRLTKLPDSNRCTLEFTLDSDVPCNVVLITHAREDIIGGSAVFPDAHHTSRPYQFPAGIGQTFDHVDYVINPDEFSGSMFKCTCSGNEPIPLIIHSDVEGNPSHSHSVFCVFEKSTDNVYSIKVLKQKQVIDGISFILQEIYGMESKGTSEKSEGSGECVVCLSAPRDTMILPCRHLCLCYNCAENVRFQSNGCLMCRQPFRALLRIEALQRITDETEEKSENEDQYEHVDLVQYTADMTSSLDSRSISEAVDMLVSQSDVRNITVQNVDDDQTRVFHVDAERPPDSALTTPDSSAEEAPSLNRASQQGSVDEAEELLVEEAREGEEEKEPTETDRFLS